MDRGGPHTELTIEDLLRVKSISDVQVDPMGRRVAFVVAGTTVASGARDAVSRVWLADVAGGAPRQITHGPGSDDLPRWSPDGTQLLYRSDRAGRGMKRLYRLGEGPADAAPFGSLAGQVTAIHWAPDGSRVAVIVEDPREPAAENGHDGDDPILYDEDTPCARVWLVDAVSGDAHCLTPGRLHVWEIDWMPDERALVAIVTDVPLFDAWYRARLVTIDVDSGETRTVYSPVTEGRQIRHPTCSPDGRAIAVLSATWSDPPGTSGDVLLVPASGTGDARNLTAGQPRSFQTLRWLVARRQGTARRRPGAQPGGGLPRLGRGDDPDALVRRVRFRTQWGLDQHGRHRPRGRCLQPDEAA